MTWRPVIPLLVLACVLVSCTRRPLYVELSEGADLTVYVDWSGTPLEPEGVTVLFYPSDGRPPHRFYGNSDTLKVNVPKGSYSIVVLNENLDDFDNTLFRDVDDIGRFSAYTLPEAGASYTHIRFPEELASWCCPSFTVDDDLVYMTRRIRAGYSPPEEYIRHLSVRAEPRLITSVLNIRLSVVRLNKLASAGGYLIGFADALGMSGGLPSSSGGVFRLTFEDRQFTSSTDGYLSLSFVCFGTRGGEDVRLEGYEFDFRASLVDGSGYKNRCPVDGNVSVRRGGWGERIIDIELGPYVIPDVEGDKGWEVDLGEWDRVDVPVDIS